MKNQTTPLPPAPELKVLGAYLDKLPPMIARKEVKWFTGGAVSSKKVSNDDYLGNGPPCPAKDRGRRGLSHRLFSGLP